MSVDVITAVLKRSEAKGVDRLVLLVLADVAHHDGVGWMLQENIAERANCSTREVRNATSALRVRGELEQRAAQAGRTRLNIYRVCLEPVGQIAVDYTRVPYVIEHPFSGLRPEEIAARREEEIAARQAAKTEDDDRQSAAVTTGNLRHDDRQVRAGHEPSLEPRSLEPKPSGPDRTLGARDVAASAKSAKPVPSGPGVDEAGLSRLSPSDGLTHDPEGTPNA